MTHARLIFPGLLLCISAASAQDAPRPTFEVASVKPSAPLGAPSGIAGAAPPGVQDMIQDRIFTARGSGVIPMVDKSRISLHRRTLASLIAAAWRLPADQVTGPAWMSELRFDIDATLAAGAPAASVNEMLQSLLEDRFSLRFHRENKEVAGYALVVAKGGAKLIPAAPAAEPLDEDAMKKKAAADRVTLMANMKSAAEGGASRGGSSSSWSNSSATMAQLAAHLVQNIHRPVIDATQISGAYSVELVIQLAPDDDPASAASQALSRYGLRLEPRKVPAEWLVVDSISKDPKEN